jgi:hypothetical protein
MVVARRHQHDAVAEPDILRALRTSREENFRRGGMRIFFEEVMLDFPGVVDAKPVGQFYLVERILKQLEFVTFMPRPRELMLIVSSPQGGRE